MVPARPMFLGAPPAWALRRPKPLLQRVYDFVGAPLRMALLPDHGTERLHLTSLRAERLAAVLAELRGRVLDIGAGDNMLLQLYRSQAIGTAAEPAAATSVGVDVFDWGSECLIVPNCRRLPFPNASFDTVSFVACLNHIPEREEALAEAYRVLKPGGRLLVTMIDRLIGKVGHAIWWYSEDKHREIQEGEMMGMDPSDVLSFIHGAGFADVERRRFLYGLNSLYIARRAPDFLEQTAQLEQRRHEGQFAGKSLHDDQPDKC
jgi:SAM-dependent methyltransferase